MSKSVLLTRSPCFSRYEIDAVAELVGPHADNYNCILGLPCLLEIGGYRLASTNQIVAISSGLCGDPDAVVANETSTIFSGNIFEYFLDTTIFFLLMSNV